jgi:hypothetical protein
MKFFLLLIISFCFSFSYAKEAKEQKLYKLRYIIEQQDTFAKIYKRFVYPNSIITKKTPMTQRTLTGNPHVSDWERLIPGTRIDLYIAYDYLDMSKYDLYVQKIKETLDKLRAQSETENNRTDYLPQGFKGSFYYMASYGKFSQADPEIAEVEYFQNSPATLGLSFSYFPKNSRWSFASSAYYSYLLASGNNLDGADVDVAPEVGITFYNEYRFTDSNFTGFFGIDYERFSTFNMGGIQQDRQILLDENTALYATIGFSKLIQVFGTPFFNKFSFSRSLMTTIETHPEGIENDKTYEGYKFLWYLNKKFTDRFYLHTLFKYHSMEGPSELNTLRLGVGFGYILF